MLAPVPMNQTGRLAAIRRYDLGVDAHHGAFDGIAELAAQVCACPVALVSIVREEDQRFEAVCGLSADSTGLEASICSHAILQEEILEIPDLRLDMRTHDNPVVTDADDPMLFYAGAQIVTPDGFALGTLCVLDRRPRRMGDQARRALRILADQVMRRLELHDALRQQEVLRREIDHRVKNNLANVAILTRMASRTAVSPETREVLASVERRIQVMVELQGELYAGDARPGQDATVDVPSFLGKIAAHLQAMAPDGVSLEADFAPLTLQSRRASALGVLVNELAANSCKHGFPDGRAGCIVLSGAVDGDGLYSITCTDNGVGAMAPAGGGGLGTRIMRASASQLGGDLALAPAAEGYLGRVRFAPDALPH
ncbi:histidine kinase dimerization/phosphoacceptor domain -containing protein [Jannaschia sp. LMIT008]|uniref:histidine kinase dimerization/phosphoacceptor domain -containing protein n=1 Tax=Jannaschia maritima TaxID=3032585 RepID=UPI00281257DD|nr:histidine kinase dimerization/phosphoacceptor domain -containing protein [Jannaschia sp. LMIT008]